MVRQVTWSGGHTPTGQDALFQFLAQLNTAKSYRFIVQQSYSDGSIVNWSGSQNSEAPAPTIEDKSSLGVGEGGSTTLTVAALVIGVLGLLATGVALASGSGDRPLV